MPDAAKRERKSARARERYATDPEYREKVLARCRERYSSDPAFREAAKARAAARVEADPEARRRYAAEHSRRPEVRARARERYSDDAEYREKLLEGQARRYAARTPEEIARRRATKAHLKGKYGLSPEDVETMLEAQGGLCCICGVAMLLSGPAACRGRANIDHCHVTKKVRGILCSGCNKGLGAFSDDIDLLLAAVEYLTERS